MTRTRAVRFTPLAFCLAIGLAGCESSGAEAPKANIAAGRTKFLMSCAICHGENAEGVEGLGVTLSKSAFVKESEPTALAGMIREGRAADHPDSIWGVAMSPLGGNAALTADDLRDIVAFLKTL